MKNTFTLETIEVFREASAISKKVVPLNGKHKKGIDFVKGIEGSQEVSRMTMSGESK